MIVFVFVFPLLGELSLHEGGVKDCCFSPDGNLFASTSNDTTVRVWDVGSLKCISTITKNTEPLVMGGWG